MLRTHALIRPAGSRMFHATHQRKDLATFVLPVVNGLQTVHTMGVPWGLLIPAITIVLRMCTTFPIAFNSQKRNQIQTSLRPILAATGPVLRSRLAAVSNYRQSQSKQPLTPAQIQLVAAKERRKAQKRLFKLYGVQTWKSLSLPLIQMPLWVILSLSIRSMSGSTFIEGISAERSLSQEGFLWLSDLMLPDQYGVLPMLVGACMIANVEFRARSLLLLSGAGGKRDPLRPSLVSSLINVSRITGVGMMVFSYHVPAALSLYWLSSAFFSLVQNIWLNKYIPIRYVPQESLVQKGESLEVYSSGEVVQKVLKLDGEKQ